MVCIGSEQERDHGGLLHHSEDAKPDEVSEDLESM